jgi:hypothetical protein
MTFDRAATLVVTRGSATDPSNNAALNVFAVNPYTGALTSTTHFEGYGENVLYGVSLPYVRGTDGGHHGLAFARQPGLDILFDGYSGDADFGTSMTNYVLDVSTGSFPATGWEWGLGPAVADPTVVIAIPFSASTWGSAGDSIFTDRGGKVVVLTSTLGTGQIAVWPVTADGSLTYPQSGWDMAYFVVSGEMGDGPAHGVFTGTLR